MKKLLLLTLLVPLAFAGWQTIAALAIATSLTLLVIIYMIGMGFGINELQIMAKEELFQLIAMALMVVLLVSSDGILNALSQNPAFAVAGADQPTLQAGARKIIDDTLQNLGNDIGDIEGMDLSISNQASRSSQCSVAGGGHSLGFGVSGCGGYSMLATPLSMAGGIMGFAIGELNAMKRLIQISELFALNFILPIGILLRTFKLTRGGGGLLIALAISLYIVVPIGIIFNEMLGQTFLNSSDASLATAIQDYKNSPNTNIEECDSLDVGSVFSDSGNVKNALDAYSTMKGDIRGYLYAILIRGTLGPVLALLMMAASLRALTSVMGAEIDVSALSRFV